MAEPSELGRFLRARRERIRPADVGLPRGTGVRRTPGLRREELATLAGVSIDYYTRLERGRENNPSPGVLNTLSEALRLDAEERRYLYRLAAGAADRVPCRRRSYPSHNVRSTVTALLESLRPNPAYLLSRVSDVLAANPGGAMLHPGMGDWPAARRNTIRYTFLHPAARTLWPDWRAKANGCVAHLRAVAGDHPDAPDLAALVGELTVKSPEFSALWERYEVRAVAYGQKTFQHPEVGTLTLDHETLTVNRADGQRLVVFLAEPGSPDHDAMALLDIAGQQAAHGAGPAGASPASAST